MNENNKIRKGPIESFILYPPACTDIDKAKLFALYWFEFSADKMKVTLEVNSRRQKNIAAISYVIDPEIPRDDLFSAIGQRWDFIQKDLRTIQQMALIYGNLKTGTKVGEAQRKFISSLMKDLCVQYLENYVELSNTRSLAKGKRLGSDNHTFPVMDQYMILDIMREFIDDKKETKWAKKIQYSPSFDSIEKKIIESGAMLETMSDKFWENYEFEQETDRGSVSAKVEIKSEQSPDPIADDFLWTMSHIQKALHQCDDVWIAVVQNQKWENKGVLNELVIDGKEQMQAWIKSAKQRFDRCENNLRNYEGAKKYEYNQLADELHEMAHGRDYPPKKGLFAKLDALAGQLDREKLEREIFSQRHKG